MEKAFLMALQRAPQVERESSRETDKPFLTRAEASGPPIHLIEVMCAAYHDRSISPGSKRAPWSQITDEWRAEAHLDMRAAVLAGVAAGYRMVGP